MLGAKTIARAKVNLFLDVGPRRSDGYHEICSVMQSLELSDELYFRRTDGSGGRVVLRCNEKELPTGEKNIVWKAIETFASETGVMNDEGVEVIINKRIPVGAGLAGGSADAAATLVAMNYIWELDLPQEKLMEIGASIGSDVPFCIIGGTALASGRGEKIEPLQSLPQIQVVLASPGGEVSTEEVYRRFDSLADGAGLSKEEVERTLENLLEGIRNSDLESIEANLHNSLESATIAAYQVEQYKSAALAAGARASLMTGSGPTVFAIVTGLEEASDVAWELEKLAPITIVTNFSSEGAVISR